MSEPRSERASIEWECRDCPRCGGSGLVVVFHPRHDGSRTIIRGDLSRTAAEVAGHCDCRIGEWIRHRTEPRLQHRIPRVADILEGRSSWLLEPPGGELIPGADESTRAAINKFFPVVAEAAS